MAVTSGGAGGRGVDSSVGTMDSMGSSEVSEEVIVGVGGGRVVGEGEGTEE